MKQFQSFLNDNAINESEEVRKQLKKTAKGTQIHFDHPEHGPQKGSYGGLGRMHGHTYAKVGHSSGPLKNHTTWLPLHHVKKIGE